MHCHYRTQGTCSRAIDFDLEDGKVLHVNFDGGCSGNTQGVAKLVEGMDAKALVSTLKGIRCGWKETSCPDQLAKAVEEALAK